MNIRDLFILMLVCLSWAGNLVVSAWAVGVEPVPPFMLGAVRAAIVLLVMGVYLFRPLPQNFLLLLFVCLCAGVIHLGFLYTGLQTASASGGSIVAQMLIPFATIMSVIFLKEKIGWRRGLCIIGAFIGVIVIIYEPGALALDVGLFYITLSYLALAAGSVAMKRVGTVSWQQYVAWVSALLLPIMTIMSGMLETGQAETWAYSKGPLLITAIYAAMAVAVFAHGQYYKLIQRYDISVVVPLTLMTPVFACILGVVFLDEIIHPRYFLGAALILPCVYIIARRQNIRILPEE